MTFRLTQKHIFLGTTIWWGTFLILSIFQINPFQIQNIVGISALLILPGLLTIILLGLINLEWWGKIMLILSISILEIIGVGLFVNELFPHIGINRPLEASPVLLTLTMLIVSLLLLVYIRVREIDLSLKKYIVFDSILDTFVALFPAIFTLLAFLGSISINNGGSNLWTIGMLVGIGVYAFILIKYHKRLGENVIPVALFFISLSLLFMTSLRSWYISGHDIQREYRVFQLAKDAGLWSIANYKDAYNACMSITILPTILSNLLNLSDQYIYKTLFQIIFATVPSAIFLIARRYVSGAAALTAAVYFIAFPTFFTDMAFLNRQEIAFLFLVVMFYTIWSDSIMLHTKRILFTFLGVGLVLSHYSTTYIVIGLLGFLVTARPFYLWLTKRLRSFKWFQNSGVAALEENHVSARNITVGMVVFLAAASFVWSSVLTDTSSNSIYRVVTETIHVMQHNAKEDSRSNDVLYSLFSWRVSDPATDFETYKKTVVAPLRAEMPDAFYPDGTYSDDSIHLVEETLLPLTALGKAVENEGINVPQFNFLFRQSSAKLLQIFILIGVVAVFVTRRFVSKPLPDEFMLLVGGSILLILSQVLLPVLSVEYGLLRAFQQSLIFLGIFVVIGSEVIFMWSKKTTMIAGTIAVVFLLSSTGVFTEALGGYMPQMHLENRGVYYDVFYEHRGEGVGIDWLVSRMRSNDGYTLQSSTQSDRYSSSKLPILTKVDILNDIYPGIVQKNAYIFLGYTNIKKGEVALSYQGDTLSYVYPLNFLDDHKDLIYVNQGVKIYR